MTAARPVEPARVVADSSNPTLSRKLIVDFAAASVVYRVVDDRTSRVVTQFPDDSTLRRRAYYRTLDTLKADAERASGHETDRQA